MWKKMKSSKQQSTKIGDHSLYIDQIIGIGEEEAMFDGHVVDVVFQWGADGGTEQTLLNAKPLTLPLLIIFILRTYN